MSIFEWLRRTSREKSASNIIDGLRQLVAAVRADVEAMNSAGQTAALAAVHEQQGGKVSQAEIMAQAPALRRRRNRKANISSAQQKLYDDLTRWSSIPPGRCLNEVVLPALFSGDLVAQSEPSFGPAIVAAYRVCEAAARQKGANLEAHTPPEILQIVNDAGDLYN